MFDMAAATSLNGAGDFSHRSSPYDPYGGQQQSPYQQYQQPSYPPPMQRPGGQIPGADKKIVAGICAILLGGLGVHKFILGYKNEGLILLAANLGGLILGSVIGALTCGVGFILFLLPFAAGVVGIVEGILYLTKSDHEFVSTYITGRRPWF
jgi:TM2 domain-containing membrane protein YozV